ncbi:hypothetical protein KSP39_PZI013899 [Platanthera zijinensis]|uniref:Uncharacterized protein n=1 Tax=Platanthera zijinensis TaxID=2320716 RepID=A0AAP0BCR7_9ASPA
MHKEVTIDLHWVKWLKKLLQAIQTSCKDFTPPSHQNAAGNIDALLSCYWSCVNCDWMVPGVVGQRERGATTTVGNFLADVVAVVEEPRGTLRQKAADSG